MKKITMLLAFIAGSFAMQAQIEAPQPSPFTKVEQKVGLTDFTLEYSRPGVRGRTIFGDLVPYGKVWRTGANANTKISFSDDVKVGGKELAAGTYALYTIPDENQWEVIFYKDANNWGNPQDWKEDRVAAKAMAEVDELPFSMETFTIMIDDLTNDSAMLNIVWDQTVASLKIEVPTEKRAMASIERVMKGPGAGDYFAAASYYHDEGKDLDKAYEWIQKAVEMGNPDAYWVLRRKSLIEADLGKKKEAIATAKLSLEKAEKAGNADYVKMNKESIAEWEN